MEPPNRSTTARAIGSGVLWIAVTVVALLALEATLGIQRVVREIGSAETEFVVLVAIAVCIGLVGRSVGLWIVFRTVGVTAPFRRCVALVPVMTFLNNVVPSGQLGGTPINGGLVARVLDHEYEVGLAGVGAATALNNAVIVSLAFGGATYLAVIGVGNGIPSAAVAGAILLVVMALTAVLLVRHVDAVTELLERAIRAVVAVLPGAGVDAIDVSGRVERFRTSVGSVAHAPGATGSILGIQATGRGFRTVGLWTALASVGVSVDPILLFVAMPVAMLAAIVPLPLGGGSVDAVLVTVLVTVAPVEPTATAAGVLLFRAVDLAVLFVGAVAGAWVVHGPE